MYAQGLRAFHCRRDVSQQAHLPVYRTSSTNLPNSISLPSQLQTNSLLSTLTMRFPDVEFESDTQSFINNIRRHSNSNSGTISPLFLPRRMQITNIEMGFFAHESWEQVFARKVRRQNVGNVAVVLFGVLGTLAWAASVMVWIGS
jgi:hypothetical protein